MTAGRPQRPTTLYPDRLAHIAPCSFSRSCLANIFVLLSFPSSRPCRFGFSKQVHLSAPTTRLLNTLQASSLARTAGPIREICFHLLSKESAKRAWVYRAEVLAPLRSEFSSSEAAQAPLPLSDLQPSRAFPPQGNTIWAELQLEAGPGGALKGQLVNRHWLFGPSTPGQRRVGPPTACASCSSFALFFAFQIALWH